MSIERLPTRQESDQEKLQLQIRLLQQELKKVQQQTLAFETVLRTHLASLIVETQELHILYKAIKKAKKVKRLEQKKRGKNYKEPKGVQRIPKKKLSEVSLEDEKEKKRLYREAMLHVHPDKFSMNAGEAEVATEVTTRLIEIYKTESLETLRAYHAHIFSGNTDISLSQSASGVQVLTKVPKEAYGPLGSRVERRKEGGNTYLELELTKLKEELKKAKNNHLYKVTTEYKEPLIFVDELREYYVDRIEKLKKRTRKGL